MSEYWKDIEGYEGYYIISSLGRIKRLSREKKTLRGKLTVRPELTLKTDSKTGYPSTRLNINGECKTFKIHRLVAIHFIPNDDPKVYIHVNHKNKNIQDFSISNLEWCTVSENVKHGKRDDFVIMDNRGKDSTILRAKKIIKIDGNVTEKGTTANVLNIEAASKGISLTEYIRITLNEKAKGLKSKQ